MAQHLQRGCVEILRNSHISLPLAWQPGLTSNLRLRVGVSVTGSLTQTLSQSLALLHSSSVPDSDSEPDSLHWPPVRPAF
jgi:hypothetical protein